MDISFYFRISPEKTPKIVLPVTTFSLLFPLVSRTRVENGCPLAEPAGCCCRWNILPLPKSTPNPLPEEIPVNVIAAACAWEDALWLDGGRLKANFVLLTVWANCCCCPINKGIAVVCWGRPLNVIPRPVFGGEDKGEALILEMLGGWWIDEEAVLCLGGGGVGLFTDTDQQGS